MYRLLHDNVNLQWKNEVETLLQQIKNSKTKDDTLRLPNTRISFFLP